MEVFLHGHGNWDPNDGFVTVPPNCRVIMHTHFAKTMVWEQVKMILSGKEPEGYTETSIYNAGISVPDLGLFGLYGNEYDRAHAAFASHDGYAGDNASIDDVFASQRILHMRPRHEDHLSVRSSIGDLMANYCDLLARLGEEITFHWMACAVVKLSGEIVDDLDRVLNVQDVRATTLPCEYRWEWSKQTSKPHEIVGMKGTETTTRSGLGTRSRDNVVTIEERAPVTEFKGQEGTMLSHRRRKRKPPAKAGAAP